MKESPAFTRTYDLVRWLIPLTIKFPRPHRFVLASALQRTALLLQEQLLEAALSAQPQPFLRRADVTLAKPSIDRCYFFAEPDSTLVHLGC